MQRPTSVTVFGILNIVFAALGFFGVVASVMMFTATAASSNNPVIQLVQDNPSYAAYMKVSIVLSVIISVVLLVTGIGLLKLKSWARTLSIIYGIVAIIMVIASSIMNYFFSSNRCWKKRARSKDSKRRQPWAGPLAVCLAVVSELFIRFCC
jgi:peptidoglycan/LPS O-acetylase OafA/YrhL